MTALSPALSPVTSDVSADGSDHAHNVSASLAAEARAEMEARDAIARAYHSGVQAARSRFMADPTQPSKILASIANTDGRALGRKALRAALLADLADERIALGFKPRKR